MKRRKKKKKKNSTNGYMHSYVHISIFTAAKPGKQPKCPSTYEWIGE